MVASSAADEAQQLRPAPLYGLLGMTFSTEFRVALDIDVEGDFRGGVYVALPAIIRTNYIQRRGQTALGGVLMDIAAPSRSERQSNQYQPPNFFLHDANPFRNRPGRVLSIAATQPRSSRRGLVSYLLTLFCGMSNEGVERVWFFGNLTTNEQRLCPIG